MFGRKIDIDKAIREGDGKKFRKALRKNRDEVTAALFCGDPDVLKGILELDAAFAVDTIIARGDLETLKAALEQKPGLTESFFNGPVYTAGSLLHIAAEYNQPEIIDYLVTSQEMDVDWRQTAGWTPLHFAVCGKDRSAAVAKLLELGANPKIKLVSRSSKNSYELCRQNGDEAARRVLNTYALKTGKQKLDARKKEAAERAAGLWSSPAPGQAVFTQDLEGYRLKNVFNFATKMVMVITKDLENGQSASESKTFEDVTPEMLAEARAQLDKLNAADAPAAEAAAKPAEEKPAAAPRPKISFGK